MLIYTIRGENIEVTPAIREYVEKKVGKVERYFDEMPESTAHVNLSTYPDNSAKAEVTIPLPYITLRAEETSEDLYGSIDLVVDKLERQIRKHKTKINRKARETGLVEQSTLDVDLGEDIEEEEEQPFEVVRTKSLNLKPMFGEEAILQMEMLGHDFFIYEDADTMSTNVVYKRDDGNYGLIETNLE